MIPQTRYMIGTGYHARAGREQAWFWNRWYENTLRFADPVPQEIVVLASGGIYPPLTENQCITTQWVYLIGDLGHCHDLLAGNKSYRFCGGTAGVLFLAWTAYLNECDFIHKEQDCLAFGNWVETMYAEIGSHGCIFGSTDQMPSSETLMLVKHAFIPDFCRLYLETPSEHKPEYIGEAKFAKLEKEHPDLYCRYSFGVDRSRPLPPDMASGKPWYAQKFTRDELLKIRDSGMIEFSSLPPENKGVSTFSNCDPPKT